MEVGDESHIASIRRGKDLLVMMMMTMLMTMLMMMMMMMLVVVMVMVMVMMMTMTLKMTTTTMMVMMTMMVVMLVAMMATVWRRRGHTLNRCAMIASPLHSLSSSINPEPLSAVIFDL